MVAREPWPVRKESVHSLRALEIGCGVGLAGLVALDRGLEVCFTDYDRAPLHFVQRSARENGFDPATFSTRLLDWRDLPEETYPVILGSDSLWRGLVPLVAGLLGETAPARWSRADRLPRPEFGRCVLTSTHGTWPGLSRRDDRITLRGRPAHPGAYFTE